METKAFCGAAMAEQGFPGCPAIDDWGDGRPGGWGVFAVTTCYQQWNLRFPRKKKEAKKKEPKEWGETGLFPRGPVSPPHWKKQTITTEKRV